MEDHVTYLPPPLEGTTSTIWKELEKLEKHSWKNENRYLRAIRRRGPAYSIFCHRLPNTLGPSNMKFKKKFS